MFKQVECFCQSALHEDKLVIAKGKLQPVHHIMTGGAIM